MKNSVKKIFGILLLLAILLSAAVPGVSASGTLAEKLCPCAETEWYNNKGDHSYSWYWADPVKTYLTPLSDGGFMQVFYSGDGLYASYFYSDMSFRGRYEIPSELPIFGGFYADGNYYYVLTGQENPQESDSVEVFRITKYSTAWDRLGSASLYGANTYIPFDAGSARMAKCGKYLLIRTCHEMYASSDGKHHQANVTIEINTETMAVTDSYYIVMNSSYGYVSHSFNQFIKIENNCIVAVDHGDAYPRSACLIRYSNDCSDGTFTSRGNSCISMMDFYGNTGANYTGAELGGFEISSTAYLLAGTSIPQDGSQVGKKNIFLSVLKKNESSPTVLWFTDVVGQNTESATNPFLTKINDNSFMLSWRVEDTLYYVFLDGNGNKTTQVYQAEAELSDCEPVCTNGQILWTVYNNGLTFYSVSTTGNHVLTKKSVTLPSHQYENPMVTKQPTCYSTGTREYTCTVCGGKKTETISKIAHTYGEAVVTQQPTCCSTGSKYYTCTVCGATKTQTIAKLTTHTFDEKSAVYTDSTVSFTCPVCQNTITATCPDSITIYGKLSTDTGSYWTNFSRTVSEGDTLEFIVNPRNAAYTMTSSDTALAIVTDGSTAYPSIYAKKAGQVKIRVALAYKPSVYKEFTLTINHAYGAWSVVTPATCTTSGEKTRTCAQCGNIETQVIAPNGHTYGDWVTTTAVTHTTSGSKYRTCTVCGYKQTETIAAIGHSYSSTWKSDATNHWKECSCGEKGNVAGHTYGEWVITTEATYTTAGSKYRTCTVCGYQQIETIPMRTLAIPKITKTENTSTGVKVTWSKVTGATKYRVYYKISGASSYTKFGDVTTTSATVTGLTAGKSYVFTVKAYANKAWSSNKASSAIVYRPIPTVTKLTNAAKGITVTWGKISGATKYALYYKVNGASSWTRVSNTLTTNSATVTGLTSGKSYVFTVKAYVGGGWSGNVSSSAIVRVNAVTLSGLTNSASKTMKATWKKDTTLTGYQIQYSLKSDFSDAKTVTVKSNTTVSQTIKSLTKGKTYYVRIRGYKTVSKVTTYGAWSASKSVKISK